MVLSSETIAALIGVGGGWVLGTATDLLRRASERRSARKVAARLVYAELTVDISKVQTFFDMGYWATDSLERTAWETHRSELLYGASEARLVQLARGYSVLGDIEYLVRSGQEIRPQDRRVLKEWIEVIDRARTEAGLIGDIRGGPAVEEAFASGQS